MKNLNPTPSIKVKGAELYKREDKPNIHIMNEKFIKDNFSYEDLPIWIERSNEWYIVVEKKVFKKTKTLKQSQALVQYILENDII